MYRIVTFNITPSTIDPEIIKVIVNLTELDSIQVSTYYLFMKLVSGTTIIQLKSGIIPVRSAAYDFGKRINQNQRIAKYGPIYELTMKTQSNMIVNNISLAAILEYQIIFEFTRHPADKLPLTSSTPKGIKAYVSQ